MCKKPHQTGLEALPFFTATRGGKNSHTWEKNFPHVAAKISLQIALRCSVAVQNTVTPIP